MGVCAAENSQNSQKTSNQATYSQSFTREDVPLSYKYTAIHVYTTPNTPKKYNTENYQVDNYDNYSQNLNKQSINPIQYAQNRFEKPAPTKLDLQTITKVLNIPAPITEKINQNYNTNVYPEYKQTKPNYSEYYENKKSPTKYSLFPLDLKNNQYVTLKNPYAEEKLNYVSI